jgi:hypothetical protein
MATEQLKVEIVLDDGSVKSGFIEIEKQAKKSSKKIEGDFNSITDSLASSFKGLALAAAAAFSAAKIVQFFQASAAEAMEAEAATNAFGASLVQIGKYSQDAVNNFKGYAQTLQQTTGVSDDLIVRNAALLASIGNLSGQGLERGTKAALDLATALQIDVGTAFELVAKAATGNTAALSRYGIKISENIPKNQKFAATLELIEKRFGGLAETRLNTFAGSLLNLSNAFSDFQESVGDFIVQSPALRVVINAIAELITKFTNGIQAIQASGQDFLKPLILGVLEFANVINEFLFKPLELGFSYLTIGVKAVILGFNSLAALIAQVPKLVTEYMAKPILDFAGLMADKIVGFFDAEAGQKLKASLQGFGNVLVQETTAQVDNANLLMIESYDSLAESVDGNYMKMGDSIGSYIAKLKTAVQESKNSTKEIENNVVTTTENIKTNVDALANIVKSGMSQAIASIGAALVNGQGLFDDFGKGIVGIMGDLAINIGTTLLFTGTAIEAFITSINSLLPGSGFAAAAAGLGLIIFGGALKASVGKGGGGAPSASGGGIASNPSSSTDMTPTQDLQNQQPQTAVSVVIQGDVLDSDESGSRIVSLINQAFDKKGVVINQGVMA